MAFDERAWKQAVYEGTAPKFKYGDIPGVHVSFEDALVSFESYLDVRVRQGVQEMMDDFEPFEKAWRSYVEERSHNEAATYKHQTDDDEGAWAQLAESEHDKLNDMDLRAEWCRRIITDRMKHLTDVIRAECSTPDTEPFRLRDAYQVVGVYSKGRNCVVPIMAMAGFCPKCREPIAMDPQICDVWEDDSVHGYGMTCPACRVDGSIDFLEERFRRSFSCIPFTDTPLREFVEKVTSRRSA